MPGLFLFVRSCLARKRPVKLSITYKLGTEREAEFDISEP
jgi:hypothetical protein